MLTRALLVAAALATVPLPAAAAPGDFRVIDGVLATAPAPPAPPVARVDGADGVSYYADLRGARWDPARVRAGDRVTLAGYEGAQANQIVAAALDPHEGDVPAAAASPPTAAGPRPTVAPPVPRAVPPPTPLPEREPDERVAGRVDAIDGSAVTLRTADGRLVRADLSQVRADIRRTVRVGDQLAVFGRYGDADTLVATGFYAVR